MEQEKNFASYFGKRPHYLFSAPGRTELGGNHTDHQHGCVLAAAVNLETLAYVAENDSGMIRVQSEGYPMCEIALNDLGKKDDEKNSTPALIRGVAARFAELGATLRGFDAYCTSTVLPGSGLSSSAAFEVLLGTVINHLFCGGRFSAVQIAQIGQWAENEYFGKPCGLMDQAASSVGSIIGIDFADRPVVEKIDFDFSKCGHALCIIDSGANHADLTDEYAAITQEMNSVAAFFGKKVLRDVDELAFYENLAAIRKVCGDRACLRATHFFRENHIVAEQIRALKENDFDTFLHCVSKSGRSSWMLLQNVIPSGHTHHQEMAFALALSEKLLGGKGAVRVHGGGFAGTLQAFVPDQLLPVFRAQIEKVLGKGTCHVLSIRPTGGILVEEYK